MVDSRQQPVCKIQELYAQVAILLRDTDAWLPYLKTLGTVAQAACDTYMYYTPACGACPDFADCRYKERSPIVSGAEQVADIGRASGVNCWFCLFLDVATNVLPLLDDIEIAQAAFRSVALPPVAMRNARQVLDAWSE